MKQIIPWLLLLALFLGFYVFAIHEQDRRFFMALTVDAYRDSLRQYDPFNQDDSSSWILLKRTDMPLMLGFSEDGAAIIYPYSADMNSTQSMITHRVLVYRNGNRLFSGSRP